MKENSANPSSLHHSITPFLHHFSLSITGLHAQWGQRSGIEAVTRWIYAGCPQDAPETFTADRSIERLWTWAQAALRDARIDLNETRVAGGHAAFLILGCAPDDPAFSFLGHAAAQYNGHSPVVSCIQTTGGPAENALATAIQEAARLLDLDEDTSAILLIEDHAAWGGSAVVLQARAAAARLGLRSYAWLAPTQLAPVALMADRVSALGSAALDAAGISSAQIGLVELTATGKRPAAVAETAGLVRALRAPGLENTCAIGSLPAGLSGGLAAVVKTALSLYHRFIPAVPGWNGPELPAVWSGGPFYAPVDSRAWFTRPAAPQRLAAVSASAPGYTLLVLSEAAGQPYPLVSALGRSFTHLFPLAASDLDGLRAQAGALHAALSQSDDLQALAEESVDRFEQAAGAPYALAIVGQAPDEVQHEIELALKAVPAAFEKGREWQTPVGSYFTPAPVGQDGGVAFVYPGAFNSYPGVGKDLFFLFPDLYERLAYVAVDLGQILCERLLYPRSLERLSEAALAEIEASLNGDPIAMLSSGTILAVLYTRLLRSAFGIHPQAAFGYSLGENSMMFATGVWGSGDGPYERLDGSQAFRTRLAGPQNAVRQYWGLPALPAGASAAGLWASFVLMARPDDVRVALVGETRVYLTHINTPRQVVIAGDPDGCHRTIARLKCQALKAPFDYALHCEAMRAEQPELARLHTWPVVADPGLRLYSAAGYAPVSITTPEETSLLIAQNIATALCTPLDFPRLVQTVYADGARVFIELGAGSNCSRWIDESLKDRPHVALAINRRGSGDDVSLVRLLARLCSQRVPLDLSVLYGTPAQRMKVAS